MSALHDRPGRTLTTPEPTSRRRRRLRVQARSVWHRIDLVAHHHVGMAHAGGDDADKDFVGARLPEPKLLDGKAAFLADDRGG